MAVSLLLSLQDVLAQRGEVFLFTFHCLNVLKRRWLLCRQRLAPAAAMEIDKDSPR